MTFLAKFHLLLVHFPIAFVLAAAVAELAVIATLRQTWRAVAVANIRAGAVMGVVTAITGWLFASSPIVDVGRPLEWHRWLGVAGAAGAVCAAILASRLHESLRRPAFAYRATLFAAAALVAIAGHLGGALVWGAGFFRP
jgi:uncharacterized membrane protein